MAAVLNEGLEELVSGQDLLPEWREEGPVSLRTSPVDEGVHVLDRIVVLVEDDVQVTVPVQVPARNQLNPAPAGDVGAGAAVSEGPLNEFLVGAVPDRRLPRIQVPAVREQHSRSSNPVLSSRAHAIFAFTRCVWI